MAIEYWFSRRWYGCWIYLEITYNPEDFHSNVLMALLQRPRDDNGSTTLTLLIRPTFASFSQLEPAVSESILWPLTHASFSTQTGTHRQIYRLWLALIESVRKVMSWYIVLSVKTLSRKMFSRGRDVKWFSRYTFSRSYWRYSMPSSILASQIRRKERNQNLGSRARNSLRLSNPGLPICSKPMTTKRN